jgi:hypothetical protein
MSLMAESHWWYLFHDKMKSWDSLTRFRIDNFKLAIWYLAKAVFLNAPCSPYCFLLLVLLRTDSFKRSILHKSGCHTIMPPRGPRTKQVKVYELLNGRVAEANASVAAKLQTLDPTTFDYVTAVYVFFSDTLQS